MTRARAERRREAAKSRSRIDLAWPVDLDERLRCELASSIANRRIEFRRSDSVHSLMAREFPALFAIASDAGFILSFDVPENSPQALGRGVIGYSIKRVALN